MTFRYDNVYVNETATITGPYEIKGPFNKLFDKSYNDFYFNRDTIEQAEVKLIEESIDILLNKSKKNKNNIDLFISGDLLNQLGASNYASVNVNLPYLGIYSACATSCEGIIIASNMVEKNDLKNVIVSTSSHNLVAEKQFRYPNEYGAAKKSYSTFTTTGAASALISSDKSDIRVESATIGIPISLGITDANNMGAVMAPAAAEVIYRHLKDTKRLVGYYDLILTGDLGIYGKEILRDYMASEYNINLYNLEDAGSMIYDIKEEKVYAGGSGPACLPLTTYSYIFDKMKKKEIERVLIVATGALLNTNLVNQHIAIPAIAHAVSLEVVE